MEDTIAGERVAQRRLPRPPGLDAEAEAEGLWLEAMERSVLRELGPSPLDVWVSAWPKTLPDLRAR